MSSDYYGHIAGEEADRGLNDDGTKDAQRFRDYGRERLETALSALGEDGSDLEVLGEVELALMALSMYYGDTGTVTLNPADVVEIIDEPEPECICPPGLRARGGFTSTCPAHGSWPAATAREEQAGAGH